MFSHERRRHRCEQRPQAFPALHLRQVARALHHVVDGGELCRVVAGLPDREPLAGIGRRVGSPVHQHPQQPGEPDLFRGVVHVVERQLLAVGGGGGQRLVGEAEEAELVPHLGPPVTGAVAGDFDSGGVEAGAALGGVDVAAAVDEAKHLVGAAPDTGVEEAGSVAVGGEGEEEAFEVGLVGTVVAKVASGGITVVEQLLGAGEREEKEGKQKGGEEGRSHGGIGNGT